MSSILKALKKLENNSAQQAGGRRLTAGPAIRSALPWRMLSVGIALFFIITAIVFFMVKSPVNDPRPPSHMPGDTRESKVSKSGIPSDPADKKLQIPGKEKQTAENNVKPENPRQMEQAKQTGKKPQVPADSQPDAAASGKSAIMPALKTKSAPQKKNENTPSESRLPLPSQAGSTDTPPDILLIDSSILKLQAISWARAPENRMIVINNSILREKDTVEGYVVISIEQDAVILKKGSEKGKLVFK